jgi:DNA-binding HxlR family transcriptional regulator
LFDQIADKWSMMILAVLDDEPHRLTSEGFDLLVSD